MECRRQLDLARGPPIGKIEVLSILVFNPLPQKIFTRVLRKIGFLLLTSWAACALCQTDVELTAKQLFEQERWDQLVAFGPVAPQRSAEFDYEYGVALGHLERWDEARAALLAGSRLAPGDKRFPIELAGVAFKQKNHGRAIASLHRALRLDSKDEYANEFLGTLYFLQGNLEGALKYWNRLDQPKPRVEQVRTEPALRVQPALLDHAFAFAPANTLKLEEWQASVARVQALEIFPSSRFDLVPRPDGGFDAVFRGQEVNGWGATRLEALLRTFHGLPFQEITPEYTNLNRSAINVVSLARWDSDKRRLTTVFSSPIRKDPRWRFRLGTDWRNENWDLVNSFTGPAALLGALNLRREAFSATITRLVGARWRWSLAGEFSHRDYRNVLAGSVLTPQLLARGYQLKQISQLDYELWRSPEHRFRLSGRGVSEAGRVWSQPPESFEKLQVSLEARWLPRARGEDFETRGHLRAGRTFGGVPFDELFMLGLEHDNDLWMRAHIGTRDGRKGSAPLGRNYFLANWETDKSVYANGFLAVKLGPFLDTGKITDPSSALGAQEWLWDTGAQAKVRVLGVGVVFSYGKDLRTGNNAFYTTIER
jgi:tetratricopeptide (TPR) repeat protein